MKPLPLIILFLVIGLGILMTWRVTAEWTQAAPGRNNTESTVPVALAPVTREHLELRRTFSGSLEATRRTNVASKIAGRVERVRVDLADEVENGQVLIELNDDEEAAALRQAEAAMAVADANLREARDALEISRRTLQRQETLRDRGVTSDAQLDAARAEQLAATSRVAVAEAELQRAMSATETARIRLGYTSIAGLWTEGDDLRVVADRSVEEGDTVQANQSLITLVELDPIKSVVFVTERDYGRLQPGQSCVIRTDAYPTRTFSGKVARIAPVFEAGSRQARVELTVDNPDRQLRPGMFIRAEVVLGEEDDAITVPEAAIIRREDKEILFLANENATSVRRIVVQTGISDRGKVQVLEPELNGRVVVLGQQLLEDGAAIVVPDEQEADTSDSHSEGSP